jgi:hypothetical protein
MAAVTEPEPYEPMIAAAGTVEIAGVAWAPDRGG